MEKKKSCTYHKELFVKVLEHFGLQYFKLVSISLANHFGFSANLSLQTEEEK